MRICGIDPGLKLTGYGVIDFSPTRPRVVDAGIIRLSPKLTVAERLVELEQSLVDIFAEHKPAMVAVEKLYAHYAHPATAIIMGHGRGVVMLCAQRAGITLKEFAANRVKRALVGFGHAGKAQMQRGIASIFQLKEIPEPPDVADALAIALCCGREMASGVQELSRLKLMKGRA